MNKKVFQGTLVCLLLLGFQGSLGAQGITSLQEAKKNAEASPEDYSIWENYGRLIHDAVLMGDSVQARDSIDLWTEIYRKFPRPIARAYLGSSWNLLARDSENVLEKIDGVQKALEELDRAVEEDPEDLVVRRIRYQNCMGLPDMFNRDQTADQDLDFLLIRYKKDPKIFDNLYDPAHIFLTKAQLLRKKNSINLSLGLARTALKIAQDPSVKKEIEIFLEM